MHFDIRTQLFKYHMYRLIVFTLLAVCCAVPALPRIWECYQYFAGGIR